MQTQMIDKLANIFADRIIKALNRKPDGYRRGPKTEAEMRCRHPRCKQRSKGPRFSYRCERHIQS